MIIPPTFRRLLGIALLMLAPAFVFSKEVPEVHVRVNLIGYLSDDQKVGIAFSNAVLKGTFVVRDRVSQKVVFTGKLVSTMATGFGAFKNHYLLDFTALQTAGDYEIMLEAYKVVSTPFSIGKNVYKDYHEALLVFMRQQRCGYNPFFDEVCHEKDGRAMGGPMPDSTYVDVSGGWHDAGDQLKYLITGSNATARMLMAYQLFPGKFKDQVNALGQAGKNGMEDVLDEAQWGLDWILKLHPQANHLFHQVADDRDHVGWKYPMTDPSNFGWGKNSYRAAYFATGKPQGLGKYKSQATGIANLAGRSAAALALGYQVWKNKPGGDAYALKCLQAAEELYAMAKAQPGYQQGNSFSAPYRYNEDTWTDDMEWGAAELFRATKKNAYLEDAKLYAEKTAALSWIEKDTSAHYQFYPFLNIAHYSLYDLVDDGFKKKLASYYKAGIDQTIRQRASKNAYSHGAPFIWCSNNLTVDLILQVILYEKMTGDKQYRPYMLAMRDWLFGRNPWGTSMFMNVPEKGDYPVDVHTSTWALTKKEIPGGLVDGPIYAAIFNRLMGLKLSQPDEFAAFQTPYVVYHDDIGDFSTNEPTMDGTACAVMMVAYFAADGK